MKGKKSANITDYFKTIEDPRMERNKLHNLWDILVITICAVVCGCETWEDIEMYGKEKEGWLRRFLQLPNGIPSHDTIRRVFIRLNPEELAASFTRWVEAVRRETKGEIVSIDGKAARRSYDSITGKGPLTMVSAWAHENRVVLGQVKSEDHSNEITAIPRLLEVLELKGCIVTIDAIGCQHGIATAIQEKKAEYVLAVKGNQPKLHEEIQWFFDDIDEDTDRAEGLVDYHKTVDKDHGRIEIREYMISEEIDWLLPTLKDWKGARSIGMVRSKRIIGKKETCEHRYYISSLPQNAEVFGKAVRAHWGVENSLHWVLDMVFREDESRMRMGNSPENFAVLRRIALNLVKQDTQSKFSLKARRKAAGWSNT